MDLLLSESRILFCDAKNNDVYSHVKFQQNSFTCNLGKLLVHFSTDAEPGNYVEALDFKNMYNQGLWRIIENDPMDYSDPLNKNDYFRLGRQIIRVAKIFTQKPSANGTGGQPGGNPGAPGYQGGSLRYLNYGNGSQKDVSGVVGSQKGVETGKESSRLINTPLCRICLDPETPSKKFTPDLCKCKNMPVHVTCLRSWMSTKIQSTNFKNMAYYDITQLNCEVCHDHIPPLITVDGEEVFLVTINLQSWEDVVILEIFELTRERLKGILVIDFGQGGANKDISLGRSDDCDILFKDQTISKLHCKLTWRNKQLFVFNIDSKFGTVRRVNGRLPIADCAKYRFVMDKFLINFHLMVGKKRCKCIRSGKVKVLVNPIDRNSKLLMAEPSQVDQARTAQPVLPSSLNRLPPPNVHMTKQNTPALDYTSSQTTTVSAIPAVANNQGRALLRPPVTGGTNNHNTNPTANNLGDEIYRSFRTPAPASPTQGFQPSLRSLRIIDNANITPMPYEEDDNDITTSKDLIAQEFAKDALHQRYANVHKDALSSQRLLDVLAEQNKRSTFPIDEEDNSGADDFGGDTTESQIKKIRYQNDQIIREQAVMYRMSTESCRTISDFYCESVKDFNFN